MFWVQRAGCLSQRVCVAAARWRCLWLLFAELCDRERNWVRPRARRESRTHSVLLQLNLPTHSNRTNAPFGVITQGKDRDT